MNDNEFAKLMGSLTATNDDAPPEWLSELASDTSSPSWLEELVADDAALPWESDNWGLIAPRVKAIPDFAAMARQEDSRSHRLSARKVRALLLMDCKVYTGSEEHLSVNPSGLVSAELASIIGDIKSFANGKPEQQTIAYDNGVEVRHWASASSDCDSFIVVSYDDSCGNYDVIIQKRTGGEVALSNKDIKAISHKLADLVQ